MYLWNLWADRTWYEGHRADLEGGSYHDEEVCLVLVDGHRLVELVTEALAEENDVRFHNTLACGGLRGTGLVTCRKRKVSSLNFLLHITLAKNHVICLGANLLR